MDSEPIRVVLVARSHPEAQQVVLKWAEVYPELAGAHVAATSVADRAWEGIGVIDRVYVTQYARTLRVPYRRVLSALKWRLRGPRSEPYFYFLPESTTTPMYRRPVDEVLDGLRLDEPYVPEDIAG
jgi:hypothetical protein